MLQKLEETMQDLKFKKKLLFMRLKEFYFNMLLNDKDLLSYEKTVVSVVQRLWQIKVDVKDFNFSTFYEKKDIDFIMAYARLMNSFQDLKERNSLTKKQ